MVCAWRLWLHATQLGTTGTARPMGLSQRACTSTGAFLNRRCASTAGFRTLQFKPQSRFVACDDDDDARACRWFGYSSRWPRNESRGIFLYSSRIQSGRACGIWWVQGTFLTSRHKLTAHPAALLLVFHYPHFTLCLEKWRHYVLASNLAKWWPIFKIF